uniref:GTPase Era isoform X2 n=1 Tax=Rhizophora mucronata TaxID=61149 RepID=A0A2P2L1H8_RHIMU
MDMEGKFGYYDIDFILLDQRCHTIVRILHNSYYQQSTYFSSLYICESFIIPSILSVSSSWQQCNLPWKFCPSTLISSSFLLSQVQNYGTYVLALLYGKVSICLVLIAPQSISICFVISYSMLEEPMGIG